MNTITLKLTKEEAKHGCVKRVSDPLIGGTITVTIPAGTVNGQIYKICRAGSASREPAAPVSVRVFIIRHSAFVPILIVALLLIAGLVLYTVVSFVNDNKTTLPVAPEVTEKISSVENKPIFVSSEPSNYQIIDVAVPDGEAAELVPNIQYRYFILGMTEAQRNNFCDLYRAAKHFSPKCTFEVPIEKNEFLSLLAALQYECPELFQLDFGKNISFKLDNKTGNVKSVDLNYRIDEETYLSDLEQCRSVIDEIKQQADGMDESAKEKLVYDFIVSNCVYKMEDGSPATAFGALVDHKAKCDGLSLAMKWLYEEVGMTCICLRGDPVIGEIGHAWNMVLVNGAFYAVDVTADIQAEGKELDPLYLAYNVPSDWVAGYYTESSGLALFRDIPYCDTVKNSYHVLNGTLIDENSKAYSVLSKELTKADNGSKFACFQFMSEVDREAFMRRLSSMFERWARANHPGASCRFTYTEKYNVLSITIEDQ